MIRVSVVDTKYNGLCARLTRSIVKTGHYRKFCGNVSLTLCTEARYDTFANMWHLCFEDPAETRNCLLMTEQTDDPQANGVLTIVVHSLCKAPFLVDHCL